MSNEHTDVKQHILDTGRTIILGKGFSAVGLNEILATAQVPKGSFYHYFKSKESFGEALVDSYMKDYLTHVDLLLLPDGTPAAERLMRYWQSWASTGDGQTAECNCLVVKLSGEVSDMSEAMRVALLRGTNLIIERLGLCIREGLADGSLSNDFDAKQTALTLYELWLGAALLTKIRRERSAMDAAMTATLGLLKLPRLTAA
ncbi:TetR/AcrR family transcriptional regulator [Polaromonas sp. CG_9.11]|uniref:TetR/AcrR family transcriptional regulator n=1 Tax=Polaromonas sp. CG_9.11 TaxID=2787730 RepID=UPI0018C92FD0|nr:TetR/AcrR family transcriptional regulator [Polaromonas sp. CG_9.11]MBG6075647.1 TetR/AcrR family transcriptional repressor of nem operon [Polaromonas sp. CG_9.11]